jgi:GAF domain-containing protein
LANLTTSIKEQEKYCEDLELSNRNQEKIRDSIDQSLLEKNLQENENRIREQLGVIEDQAKYDLKEDYRRTCEEKLLNWKRRGNWG